MKKNIETKEDIKLLIDTFYGKVRKNETLGYIFDDIAKLDWEKHLPVMYAFWSSLLLGDRSYEGNVMGPHIQLNKKVKLTSKEFSEWLKLFTETVDELFEGVNAKEAKSRAESIARLMEFKVGNQ